MNIKTYTGYGIVDTPMPIRDVLNKPDGMFQESLLKAMGKALILIHDQNEKILNNQRICTSTITFGNKKE